MKLVAGVFVARCESIRFVPHAVEIIDGAISWIPLKYGGIDGLPQILWENGDPWREANIWLLDRGRKKDIQTVQSNARPLHAYAQWLESTKDSSRPVEWWEFPADEAERCLFRYCGFLIREIDAGTLAPSTASTRMRDASNFIDGSMRTA